MFRKKSRARSMSKPAGEYGRRRSLSRAALEATTTLS